MISFLVTNQSVQTGDFEKDRAAADATRDTIARALQVSLATMPIATSSSGFVYRLDPELGTVSRVSDSFGTFFVERAMTSGRGRASFGASASTAGYDQLDGFNLRDGTLLTTANRFRDEPAPFDTEALTLKIRTSTLTFFGAYGVTDRFEISGAVPLVQMNIDGTRVNVYRGQSFVQASGTASASGMADVAVRARYRLFAARNGGIAAAAEVRLPTGNEQLLLGAGSAALRLMGIASAENGVGRRARQLLDRPGRRLERDCRAAARSRLRRRRRSPLRANCCSAGCRTCGRWSPCPPTTRRAPA